MEPEPQTDKTTSRWSEGRWQWRHAILLIGVLLAAEQVRSASVVYLQYERVRELSLRGELGSLQRPMRKAMGGPRGIDNHQEALDAFVEEHYDQGLRYIAWRNPGDSVMYESGDRRISPTLGQMFSERDFTPVAKEFELTDGRIFTVLPALHLIFRQRSAEMPPRGAGAPPHRPPRKEPLFDRRGSERVPLTSLTDEQLDRYFRQLPPVQIIEMEPRATLALRNRTLAILAVGIIGALITLLGSLYIWWLIGRKQQAEKEAEEKRMLATLGKMSAVISHELRNPLAGAKGQVELLQMMLEEPKFQKKAGQIHEELERLEELSETLLSFVNSRRIAPAMYPCEQLVNDLKSLARDKRLEVDASQMPAEWRYDAITLVRAVDNLVSNALSFTPEDGKVYLRLWEENQRLHISVRDEGPGFPEGMEDMFEPFVTTRIKGTGLGMAIAAEVVRAHGGEISAQNHPEGGAWLQLWLPATHT